MLKAIQDFLKLEAASGMLLVLAAVLALLVANSPLSPLYDSLITLPVEVRIGEFQIDKPLLLWINDGLMALFFLLVGLELKREFVDGELSDLRAVALQGWAIPAATDIAFACAAEVRRARNPGWRRPGPADSAAAGPALAGRRAGARSAFRRGIRRAASVRVRQRGTDAFGAA